MARIRSIHPGVWSDEKFATLSMAARVLVFGLWTDADDHGVFEWKPIGLKMRIYPADNIEVGPLLDELAAANVVMPFTVDGKEYGAVRNFCRFQSPRRPSFKHPCPDSVRNYIGSTPSIPDNVGSAPVPVRYGEGEGEGEGEGKGERKKDAAHAAPELKLVADEPLDNPEKALFDRGKQVLGQNAGGQIRKLLNAKGGKVALARAAIEQAAEKQNPREYIARAIIGPANEVDAREEAKLIEAWKTKHKRAVVFDTDRPAAVAEMLADRARASL